MPERKHNLPTMFSRLDDQITEDVLDAIVIEAHSRRILYLPGEYTSENRPSGHRVRLIGDIRRHAGSCGGTRSHGVTPGNVLQPAPSGACMVLP